MTEVPAEIIERNIRVTLARLKVILARDKFALALLRTAQAMKRADDLRAGGDGQ